MKIDVRRLTIAAAALLVMTAASGCGGQEETPAKETAPAASAPASVQPPAGKKEFVLRGKVESVDAAAGSMSVNHENVDGWMAAMTMMYKPDQPAILEKIKKGDQITAKVYEGDFAMLYDIQIVGAAQ